MELWSAERVLVKGRFEKDWGVAVESDGTIQAIGPRAQLVANAKRVHHHPDKILLPAHVNPHHHGVDRLFRPLTDLDLPYRQLVQRVIWPLSGAVNRDLFEAIYRVALAEQAVSGIGSVGEMFYMHNGCYAEGQSQFTDRLIRVALDTGVRLSLIFTFFDQGSEDVKAFIQPMDRSLEEFAALAEKHADEPLITLIPGIHSLAHTSPDAIIAAARLAEERDTKFHIQLAAGPADLETAAEQYGTTPLRALEKMGVLNERLVVVHGTHLEDEELDMLAGCGAEMILCPTANLSRGDRFPAPEGILSREIPFAVASGSLAMFNSYSVAEEVKLIELQLREATNSRNVLSTRAGVESLWSLGTTRPADMLGINASRFMPGAGADFVLLSQEIPCNKPGFNDGSRPHIMNEIMFGWGSRARVSHLCVQGKMLVENGRFKQDLSTSYRMLEKTCSAFLENVKKNAAPN